MITLLQQKSCCCISTLPILQVRLLFLVDFFFTPCTSQLPLNCSHCAYNLYFLSRFLIVFLLLLFFNPSWCSCSTQSSQKSARPFSNSSWSHAWSSDAWHFGITDSFIIIFLPLWVPLQLIFDYPNVPVWDAYLQAWGHWEFPNPLYPAWLLHTCGLLLSVGFLPFVELPAFSPQQDWHNQ